MAIEKEDWLKINKNHHDGFADSYEGHHAEIYTILVETHDHEVPGCYDTILERFQSSHEITVYKSRPRIMEDYPLHPSAVSRLFMSDVILGGISDRRAVSNY